MAMTAKRQKKLIYCLTLLLWLPTAAPSADEATIDQPVACRLSWWEKQPSNPPQLAQLEKLPKLQLAIGQMELPVAELEELALFPTKEAIEVVAVSHWGYRYQGRFPLEAELVWRQENGSGAAWRCGIARLRHLELLTPPQLTSFIASHQLELINGDLLPVVFPRHRPLGSGTEVSRCLSCAIEQVKVEGEKAQLLVRDEKGLYQRQQIAIKELEPLLAVVNEKGRQLTLPWSQIARIEKIASPTSGRAAELQQRQRALIESGAIVEDGHSSSQELLLMAPTSTQGQLRYRVIGKIQSHRQGSTRATEAAMNSWKSSPIIVGEEFTLENPQKSPEEESKEPVETFDFS